MSRLGLSDHSLAARTGLDRTTISLIRRGLNSPPADTLRIVSAAMHGTIEETFFDPVGLRWFDKSNGKKFE